MIKMNKMMKIILEEGEQQECSIQVDDVLKKIVDKTKIIKNCIVYDEDGALEEEKINFDRIMLFFGDKTGYEVSCNELRFSRQKIHPSQFPVFARKLSDMLFQKYNPQKIVVYISLYDDEFELRFHIYREDEKLWLDEDLNKYDKPILCWI